MSEIALIPHLAAALLLPPSLAALVAAASLLLVDLHQRTSPTKLVFNGASLAATVGLTGVAAHALGIAGAGLAESSWTGVIAFFLVALTYYSVNNQGRASQAAIDYHSNDFLDQEWVL